MAQYRRLLLSTVLGIMLTAPSLCFAVTIKGRIFDETGPFNGARVQAYNTYEDLVTGKTYSVSRPSDKNGEYEMSLPEGEYYFTSQGNKGARSYYSYHGHNPLKTGKDDQWISFNVNEEKPPVYRKGAFSLTGRVTYHGQPVKKAWLTLYTKDQKSFKGAGFLSQQTEDNGEFSITWLPPASYVLIARKVEGEQKMRPLKKGDLFCYYGKNPIEIKADKTLEVEVPCYARKAGSGLPEGGAIITGEYGSGIKGKVTDGKGKPVEHVYVIAYKGGKDKAPKPKEGGSVEYFSITDKDGNYFIPIEADENLFILARDRMGGDPVEKSMLGIYGGDPGKMLSFKKGQLLEGINIVTGER